GDVAPGRDQSGAFHAAKQFVVGVLAVGRDRIGIRKPVAPEAYLGAEGDLLRDTVLEARLVEVDVRGQPQAGRHVHAPAIKVEVVTQPAGGSIRALEANDVIAFVFDPDASDEARLLRFGLCRD